MNRFLITIIVLLSVFGMSKAQLSMQKAEGGIVIVDGTKNVLQFQVDPKSKEGKYSRCNYIHPLWGMDGQVLTEDFPADHLHQRGIFWAWHQVWIGEKRIGDPWELKNFEQEVVELEFAIRQNGSVQIKTEVDWKSNKWKKLGREVPYMKEHTIINIHKSVNNYRKIDFEISLLALEEELKIGGSEDEKGYSGFSARIVLNDDLEFAGQHGIVELQNTAIQSNDYIDISGNIGVKGKKGGIIIIDNPDNPQYPQPWILRSKNSMQNIVFPGNKLYPVSTIKPLVLKYSLLVYSGKLSPKKINKIIGF